MKEFMMAVGLLFIFTGCVGKLTQCEPVNKMNDDENITISISHAIMYGTVIGVDAMSFDGVGYTDLKMNDNNITATRPFMSYGLINLHKTKDICIMYPNKVLLNHIEYLCDESILVQLNEIKRFEAQ